MILNAGSAQSGDMTALSEFEGIELSEAKTAILTLVRYWVSHEDGIEVVPL